MLYIALKTTSIDYIMSTLMLKMFENYAMPSDGLIEHKIPKMKLNLRRIGLRLGIKKWGD